MSGWNLSLKAQDDSLNVKLTTLDSVGNHLNDRVTRKPKSGLDTIVTYSAKDTVVFHVQKEKMRLRGDADLLYKQQNLKAEVIEMDFSKNLLKSEGVSDSIGKVYGYPQFTDHGETFYGKIINYNFKTQKGSIVFGETEVDEGFYFAEKIKKEAGNIMYLKNGRFTTCDAPHPHYYFGSPKMEVKVKDRVFVDPIIFYVEDLPVFAVPFGMFFTMQSGRQSGLIIPSFFFSQNRGVTLENFGVYLALSDYYDTRFTVDYYSKGGFRVKNFTQWKYQDILNGTMNLEFGKTRFNPKEDFTRNWRFTLMHNQAFSPQERLTVNLDFSSSDYNRNTEWNLQDRQVQEITSNASYSKSFDNGSSFSLAYSRTQNIITNSYSESPSINFSLPQLYPFKSFVSSDSWLRDITFSYSGNMNYRNSRTIASNIINDTTYNDTTYSWSSKISHSPRLSLTLPKLSYFTFTPFISFSLNNYIRRGTKYMDMTDSTVKTDFQNGFFSEYSYSTGISMSTRLYGIAKPKIFGINAIRHTFQPNFSFSFRPDQSDPALGFYGEYYDSVRKANVQYSRFQADGGGIASRQLSSALNYSFVNNISVKVAQGDTLEDKTVDLLSFNLSGNYDFAKSFRRLSDVSLSFHSSTLPGMNFSGNSNFTLYDEEWQKDVNGNDVVVPTNNLLITKGKGLARMTGLRLSLSTGFSSEGAFTSSSTEQNAAQDTLSIGERFGRRLNAKEESFDFFGDKTPGFSKFSFPWNVNFTFNYSYARQTIASESQSFTVGTNFNFNITPSWYFSGSVQFDLLKREIVSPIINIRKDLHCWELNVTWYPTGYNKGFYLRFNIKSSLLKDLKWEQRSSDFF